MGSEWGAGNDFVNQKFTGKERDAESGLDYFGARYYGSALGRFTSPDWSENPEPVPFGRLDEPQTLNLYSYGLNNPLRNTDPDGHCDVDGEHHWGWCIWHTLGFYETQKDRVDQAKNFFNVNIVTIAGNRVDPSKMTDQQLLSAFKQLGDALRANGADYNPGGAWANMLPGAGLKYEPNSGKHGQTARGNISAEPTNPDETLKNSVQIKETSSARVGVDPTTASL